MGLYHIGLFATRRSDKSPLHFSIFCLLIALRTVCINERMIMDVIPILDFEVVHQIRILFLLLFFLGIYAILHYLFFNEFSKRWYRFFGIVLVSSSILVIVSHVFYTRTLLYVQITILIAIIYSLKVIIHASMNNRVGAKFF